MFSFVFLWHKRTEKYFKSKYIQYEITENQNIFRWPINRKRERKQIMHKKFFIYDNLNSFNYKGVKSKKKKKYE